MWVAGVGRTALGAGHREGRPRMSEYDRRDPDIVTDRTAG